MVQSFGPVRHTATYEVVAEHIRRALQLGRYLPGDKLPPERALALQLGVSRTVLREAIRALEGEGLVESRRGAMGGLVVLNNEVPADQLKAMIASRFDQLEQLYEFRLANECAAARFAARRRTAEDLRKISEALQRMEAIVGGVAEHNDSNTVARFTSADSAFHLGIAEASRNGFIAQAVEDAWVRRFLPIGNVFMRIEPDANNGHRRLFDAIETGNAAEAEAAMGDHIQETLATLRGYLNDRLRTR
ncbi:FadR/GntR family transcriptional regulator [Rhizorhabdus wittichii]|uniref:Transcriptional regulator, GntR family n=2 Tax=Rhizorhabdus wittichii TaxID=160791 RepID=A0A9J9HAP9_RHIWR|nr:FCD domain-containing protein [Rhizorhabdus wittichii]ABQ68037.1 transcriptional regulator, GntR family [Rhizorhabdus wittichii RW1]ARR55057.1 GntR family transcriptional regulator [Rhizorhabdus wittichii DC-6]QTH21530.1 FadR family transcriptional regulator [Rhizorhabdus wittichii]